jgi:hypothetical protein
MFDRRYRAFVLLPLGSVFSVEHEPVTWVVFSQLSLIISPMKTLPYIHTPFAPIFHLYPKRKCTYFDIVMPTRARRKASLA